MRRTVFLILILGVILPVPESSAALSREDVLSKFVAANLAYKEGDYPKAVEQYEGILEGGKESGALYFNLGNSYFKMGEYGKAVLNYERARDLIPRDSDVRFNLRYVRSVLNLSSTDAEGNLIKTAFMRHVGFYSKEEMVWIMTGAGVAAALLYLISLYLALPARPVTGGLIFFGLIFIVSTAGFYAKVRAEDGLAVMVKPQEAKFEPSGEATAHFPLKEGAKIKFLKQEGEWVKISRPDGKLGWIPAKTAEKVSHVP